MNRQRTVTGAVIICIVLASTLFRHYFPVPGHLPPSGPRDSAGENLQPRIKAHADLNPAVGAGRPGTKKHLRYRPDQPEMFARLHRELRTGARENAPSYPLGYRLRELRKAQASPLLKKPANRDITWTERGPGNVSGRTRALIVDPVDPDHNTWFAGSVSGGIWKTEDAGLSWEEKTRDLPNLATSTLAMSPANPNIIYAGTGEGFYNAEAVHGSGIFKSFDHGETWQELPVTIGNANFRDVNRIIVDPADANTVLACTNTGGIQKSNDGGITWRQVYETGYRVQQLVASPAGFNTLWATVNGMGVLKSVDGGDTWNDASNGLGPRQRLELAVAPSNPRCLYLAVENGSDSDLYRSGNGGEIWSPVVSSDGENIAWMRDQGWYDNTIAVHPYNSDIVYIGGIDIWKASLTGGSSFSTGKTIVSLQADFQRMTNWGMSRLQPGYAHADHHNIQIVPTGSSGFRIIDGNDGGVAWSDDGGKSWHQTLNGYNTTQFYGVDKKPGADEYIGGMQDNGTWQSPQGLNASASSKYSRKLGADGYHTAWNYRDGSQIIASIYYDQFAKSADGGNTWTDAVNGLTDAGENGPFVSVLGKSKIDPDLLFTTGASGVWRSDTFADDWMLARMEAFDEWGYNSVYTPIEVSVADQRIVWAGAYMSDSKKIQVSNDGGATFSSTNNYGNIGRITGIATHPLQPNTAYVLISSARNPKILRTRDLGRTWADISGFGDAGVSSNGFPDVAVYDLVVMPYDTTILWACTEIGIFESVDNGGSWACLNEDDFPAVSIWQADIVDDQLVMATHGRGIWTATIPELAGYTPPERPLTPALVAVSSGLQRCTITCRLRSPYDSTQVRINGAAVHTIFNTGVTDTSFTAHTDSLGLVDVALYAYKAGETYQSVIRKVNIFSLGEVAFSFKDNFSHFGENFAADGFRVLFADGFESKAFHSDHPYDNNREYTLTLRTPIVVSASNDTVSYRDVAIIEPCDAGAEYGEDAFNDYAVFEASRDGNTWTPLADGYDARYNDDWLYLYYNWKGGGEEQYVQHTLNLLNYFNAGDTVIFRFRLFADQRINAWGWAIDDLSIQAGNTPVSDDTETPRRFILGRNYPNPFNASTTIGFELPRNCRVRLIVYDTLGRNVAEILDKNMAAGSHLVTWNSADLASGVYFYRLTAGGNTRIKKLILLK